MTTTSPQSPDLSAARWLNDNCRQLPDETYVIGPGLLAKYGAAIRAEERERCSEIVSAARFGEVDQDFRAVIHMIEGGRTAEELKKEAASW